MAQVGFPWQAESHVREPTYLDEKTAESLQNQNPAKPLSDVSNKSPPRQQGRHHSRSIGKRRAGSLKSQVPPKMVTRNTLEARPAREGPTQLAVRTIPRKKDQDGGYYTLTLYS